jgi:hypothetical protein|tara:strand:- start:191 stop:403 length:213 start_codon:yes stop_codon:yes gene_type:complete
MNECDLDAVIALSRVPIRKNYFINGDNFSIESSSLAAITGHPSINIPKGQIDVLPLVYPYLVELGQNQFF